MIINLPNSKFIILNFKKLSEFIIYVGKYF